MAKKKESLKKSKEREEAEKRNPLLRIGLGDLIGRMFNHHITGNYDVSYQSLVKEINRRYPKPKLDYDKIERDLFKR